MSEKKHTACEEESKRPEGVHVAHFAPHPRKLWIGHSALYGYEIAEHSEWLGTRCGFKLPSVVAFCPFDFERITKLRLELGEVRPIKSIKFEVGEAVKPPLRTVK